MFINLIVLLFSTGQSASPQKIKEQATRITIKKLIYNLAFIWACSVIGRLITNIISYPKIKKDIRNIAEIKLKVESQIVEEEYQEKYKTITPEQTLDEEVNAKIEIVKKLDVKKVNERVRDAYCEKYKIGAIKNALLTGRMTQIMLADSGLKIIKSCLKPDDIAKTYIIIIIKNYFFYPFFLLALILIHYITPFSPLLLFKINGKSPIDRIVISKNARVNTILKILLHILKFPVFYVLYFFVYLFVMESILCAIGWTPIIIGYIGLVFCYRPNQ